MIIGYILQRVEDGKYVTRPGSEHSYTKVPHNALVFDTAEQARSAACGNERVISLAQLFGRS